MIIINSSLCNPAFNAAFEALQQGHAVRRASWPAGQHLKIGAADAIRVHRPGCEVFPAWAGPSNDESDAADWIVIEEPKGSN